MIRTRDNDLMNKLFLKFFWQLLAFTLFLGAIAAILYFLLPAGFLSSYLPWILLLFFVVTALANYLQFRNTDYTPRKIVSVFMLVTFTKMFIYIIAVILYLFLVGKHIPAFIVNFFILYILYLVFEVTTSINRTRKAPGSV